MENYQMSRGCRRPASCGMSGSVPYMTPHSSMNSSGPAGSCSANTTFHSFKESARYTSNNKLSCTLPEHFPLAIAYVPYQKFSTPFDTCYALKVGTIFPDLCKPFCGKRGVLR